MNPPALVVDMKDNPSRRLRLPGPIAVPERVRLATARPIVGHRSKDMRAVIGTIRQLAAPLFGTSAPLLMLACSGTGAMEASLVNILGPGESVLAVTHGLFGDRFAAIAKAMGVQVDMIETPWGQAPDIAAIASALKGEQYRAVLAVHNESSTGVVSDLAAIGALLKDTPTLLVVDSISGIGGIEFRQDEWGVDIALSVSQKALMSPPGLGLVSISDKARKVIEQDDRLPRFYWDFRKALAFVGIDETAFTPAVSLLQGLSEALIMIHEEGVDPMFARYRRLSAALRAGVAALGLAPFGDAAAYSNTVVVSSVPESLKDGDIVNHLQEHHATLIGGGLGRLKGKLIRIGTMGHLFPEDILTDLFHLEKTLVALGHPVEQPGAAFAAAMEALTNT